MKKVSYNNSQTRKKLTDIQIFNIWMATFEKIQCEL